MSDAPSLPIFATPAAWDLVAPGYVSYLAAHLSLYAADALRLAALGEDERVVDVATGPGTLAMLAARTCPVEALDFSQGMLEQLQSSANALGLTNLNVRLGDGQALPYDDGSFDAAFSMFGLMMFPDRAKGFSELARVLRPGGRAVVSSWLPQESIPLFATMGPFLGPLLKMNAPGSDGRPPLSDPEDFEREMSAAGFDVEIYKVEHTLTAPSLDALWTDLGRSHVALTHLESSMEGEAFKALTGSIYERLVEVLGPGPQQVVMPAWLALGRIR